MASNGYDGFAAAYKDLHPEWNPWTQPQKQQLANAESAVNPAWTPTADAASVSVNPTNFSPYADPNFLLSAAGIEQNKTLASGAFNYGTKTAGPQNFGYDPVLDSSGNVTGQLHLQDPTAYGYDPYNQAAELQRAYDNSKRGTTNNYAAQGQLYSGALQNAIGPNGYLAHDYGKSSDALQRSAAGYYEGLQTNLDAASNGPATSAILNSLTNFLKTQGG